MNLKPIVTLNDGNRINFTITYFNDKDNVKFSANYSATMDKVNAFIDCSGRRLIAGQLRPHGKRQGKIEL